MQQEQGVVTAVFTMEHYDSAFALWRGCDGIGLTDADSREGIERFLRRNPGMSRVALDNGRLVGTVLAGDDGRRGYLHHLAVHPDHRRRGLGQRLLAEAVVALRAATNKKCHGFVFRKNLEGLDFWRSAGWKVREDIALISLDIPPKPE